MTDSGQARGFSFATALATLLSLFLFFALVLYVYRSPNVLGESKREPVADPAERLDAVRARSKAVLDGHDPTVKVSADDSAAALAALAANSKNEKAPNGVLPFPVEAKKP